MSGGFPGGGSIPYPTNANIIGSQIQGCGRHTYIDVRELRPGGAKAIRRSITENAAAVRRRTHPPVQGVSPSNPPLSTPPRAHQHSAWPPNSSSNQPQPLSGLPLLPSFVASSVLCVGQSNNTQFRPKFLLICVEGNSYKTLPELRYLDVSEYENDEKLLRGILEQYEEVRKVDHWTMFLLVPAWFRRWKIATHIRQVWNIIPADVARISSWLSKTPLVSFMSKCWTEMVSEDGLGAPLHILDTADFVRVSIMFSMYSLVIYTSVTNDDQY